MPENITSVLIIYTGGTIGMVENSKTGKEDIYPTT